MTCWCGGRAGKGRREEKRVLSKLLCLDGTQQKRQQQNQKKRSIHDQKTHQARCRHHLRLRRRRPSSRTRSSSLRAQEEILAERGVCKSENPTCNVLQSFSLSTVMQADLHSFRVRLFLLRQKQVLRPSWCQGCWIRSEPESAWWDYWMCHEGQTCTLWWSHCPTMWRHSSIKRAGRYVHYNLLWSVRSVWFGFSTMSHFIFIDGIVTIKITKQPLKRL